MSFCVTPGCLSPQNPDNAQFCLSCGSKLLLKERYRLIQPIGRGGFGRTFLAVDESIASKPRCAIKQLYLESQSSLILKKATQLFQQEAQHLAQLGKHPQIPSLLAHFEQQKRLYLVQEFVPGKTLQQELQQGVFNEAQIWELLRDLVPVLKFIHDRNVIHRDIKPSNIIRRKHDGKLVLIDFGVAKLITDSALFHTGTAVGSVEYVAPEQMKGKALPASDLYSLGVTCIHLLTGVPPFNLFDINNNSWVWRDCLPSGTVVSDRLSQILDKLIKSAVSQRYKSASDVLQVMTEVPSAPSKIQPPPPLKQTNFLSSLWQRYNPKPQGDRLISEVGVDYKNLQYFLAAGRWKEADAETWTVMCLALSKSSGQYINIGDIHKFPCDDLQTIDRLWVKYSQGRFGFSVQKYIFESVEEDYGKFCDFIGWPTHQAQVNYLKFSLSAPVGHLPSRSWIGGSQWWRHAAAIASKLAECQIT